jgi:hypothetical protein
LYNGGKGNLDFGETKYPVCVIFYMVRPLKKVERGTGQCHQVKE